MLQHQLIAAVSGAGSRCFELGGCLAHRFAEARLDLRPTLARHSFHKFLRPHQFSPQLYRLFLQPLGHLLGLTAVLFHLFFPVRGDLAGRFLLRGKSHRLHPCGKEFLNLAQARVAYVINRAESLAHGFVHLPRYRCFRCLFCR